MNEAQERIKAHGFHEKGWLWVVENFSLSSFWYITYESSRAEQLLFKNTIKNPPSLQFMLSWRQNTLPLYGMLSLCYKIIYVTTFASKQVFLFIHSKLQVIPQR